MAGIGGPNGGEVPGSAPGGVRATFPDATPEAPAMIVVAAGNGEVSVDGTAEGIEIELFGDSRVRMRANDGVHEAVVTHLARSRSRLDGVQRYEVVIDGWRFEVGLEAEQRAGLRERATSARGGASRGGPLELHAIIPGRVVAVDVAIGDTIDAGGRLRVVEAMKMQNELRSPRGGTVSRLAVGPGQTVERGDLLLVLE